MKEMVGGCCVCSDERGWPDNPLVYCDGTSCSVAVHQACYGIVTVPQGPWYCKKCELTDKQGKVRCALCPSRSGALKETDSEGWAHVVCALYIPEVRFGNVTSMEPIILSLIPPERFNKVCYICQESGKANRAAVGACMQCNKSGCKQQFHVTCAQGLGLLCEEAGNYLDNVKYCGYCQHHYSKLKKGGNVKTIPPYKPDWPDSQSSDSAPEKEGEASPARSRLQPPRKSGPQQTAATIGKTSPHVNIKQLPLQTQPQSSIAASSKNTSVNQGNPPPPLPDTSSNADPIHTVANVKVNAQTPQAPAKSPPVSTSTAPNSGPIPVSSIPLPPSKFPPAETSPLGSDAHKQTKKRKALQGTDPSPNPVPKPDQPIVREEPPPPVVESNPEMERAITIKKAKTEGAQIVKEPDIPPTSSGRAFQMQPTSNIHSVGHNVVQRQAGKVGGLEGASSLPVSVPLPVPAVPSRLDSHLMSSNPTSEWPGLQVRYEPQTEPAAPSPRPGSFSNMNSRGMKCPPISTPVHTITVAPPSSTTFSSTAVAAAIKESPPNSPAPDANPPSSAKSAKVDRYTAHQMLGNELNPESAAAMRLARQLGPDLPAQPPSLPTFTGVPRPGSAKSTTPIGASSSAQSLDQLLERQWEQGSQFLMEQAQHFDIASLLSCLHQLRTENARLEEHVGTLQQRRDHLLAVNARLAIPLNAPVSTDSARTPSGGADQYFPRPGSERPHQLTYQQKPS